MRKNEEIFGKLLILNLSDCDARMIKNPKKIEKFVKNLCSLINMRAYGKTLLKRFGKGSLEGYSLMQFIETSSITAHFDEHKNRAFIDIFSCKNFDSKRAVDYCKKYFRCKKIKSKILFRG